MKKVLAFVLCLVLALSCTAMAEEKPLKVALILTGVANDMGWNQAAYEGLELLEKEYGCEVAYSENCTTADMAAALTDYAAAGYDIVFGHSYEFGDPMCEVAEMYPDTYFVSIEGDQGNGENVASYQLKCQESAYVIGMLAARMTQAKNVGMVSAVQSASMNKIVNGFLDGVAAVDSSVNTQVVYTGSYVDTALGKECGLAVIENGADFVYHCANDSGLGALNAAIEKGLWVCGDSYDQSSLSDEYVLTSAVYYVSKLIEKAYKDVTEGTFSGGVVEGGMADGVVVLTPFNKNVPEDVQAELTQVILQIAAGELSIVADPSVRN